VTDVTRQLTIDELARETGMTVRNIRAHQSRGLVPPPLLRGRTGYYGPAHVSRIELIRDMQSQGFNLEAIKRLLQDANGSSEEVLRFTREVREPWEPEEPQEIPLTELAERVGGNADPKLLRRAVDLGFLKMVDDERVLALSPRLLNAGRELAELGISPETALDVLTRMRESAENVAEAYVKLFLDEVWKPFDDAGRPQERWPEIRAALERLRPLAGEALLAVFGIAMTEATDAAFGRELGRVLGEDVSRPEAETPSES
jgi:DNA-binding transcriptional MerR regulator